MFGPAGSQVAISGAVAPEELTRSGHPARQLNPLAEEQLEPASDRPHTQPERPASAERSALPSIMAPRPVRHTFIANTVGARILPDSVVNYGNARLWRRCSTATPRALSQPAS